MLRESATIQDFSEGRAVVEINNLCKRALINSSAFQARVSVAMPNITRIWTKITQQRKDQEGKG